VQDRFEENKKDLFFCSNFTGVASLLIDSVWHIVFMPGSRISTILSHAASLSDAPKEGEPSGLAQGDNPQESRVNHFGRRKAISWTTRFLKISSK
jgi:hypothetical protein